MSRSSLSTLACKGESTPAGACSARLRLRRHLRSDRSHHGSGGSSAPGLSRHSHWKRGWRARVFRPAAASFYEKVTLHQTAKHGDGAPGKRVVPIRRLDTLFQAGELPAADYIKTDC